MRDTAARGAWTVDLLANRLMYRLSSVWWTAIYSGLCRSGGKQAFSPQTTPTKEHLMMAGQQI
jgi:hypothetical protein